MGLSHTLMLPVSCRFYNYEGSPASEGWRARFSVGPPPPDFFYERRKKARTQCGPWLHWLAITILFTSLSVNRAKRGDFYLRAEFFLRPCDLSRFLPFSAFKAVARWLGFRFLRKKRTFLSKFFGSTGGPKGVSSVWKSISPAESFGRDKEAQWGDSWGSGVVVVVAN